MVAVSNDLGGSGAFFKGIVDFTPPGTYAGVANSFTTGAGSGRILDSATVDLLKFTAASENITGKIYSDNAGAPGSFLATSSILNLSSSGRNNSSLDFSSAGLTLDPATTYWLYLSSDLEDANWAHKTSTTTGLPGWTIGSSMRTDVGSGTWGTVADGPGLFAINVVVPEPSAIATGVLTALAAAGYVLKRRRQKA